MGDEPAMNGDLNANVKTRCSATGDPVLDQRTDQWLSWDKVGLFGKGLTGNH